MLHSSQMGGSEMFTDSRPFAKLTINPFAVRENLRGAYIKNSNTDEIAKLDSTVLDLLLLIKVTLLNSESQHY